MNEWLALSAKLVFVFGFVFNLAALLTWMERKQSALMQDRLGANRATVFGFRAMGLFHIIADSLKMFLKEDFVPPFSNRFLHAAAPFVSAFCALAAFACIPFGDTLTVGGETIVLQAVPVDAGLLFILAFLAFGIYGVFLAGVASRNKYSLLGALRGAAQALSYEVCLGLSLVGPLLVYGTLDLRGAVAAQSGLVLGFFPLWGIVLQPVAFLVFLSAGMAESKRVPFDLPEGESEIIGYFVEYSSMRFGMFFLTDFIEVILVSALATHFFLGGWLVPWLGAAGFEFPWGGSLALPGWLVSVAQVGAYAFKVFFLCWLQLTLRWTLPRFRYDQMMDLCWKMLLPVALANILVTAFVVTGL